MKNSIGVRKYRNIPTLCNLNHKHDSKLEAKRCGELHMLQKAKKIRGLKIEPRYFIHVNDQHICDVVPDFKYEEIGDDGYLNLIIEDAKGFLTDDARIKYKLIEAVYGIPVRIIRK